MKIVNFFFLIILLPTFLLAKEINIEALIDKATKEKKHLFVYLHWKDCVYCQEMQMFTLDNENVQNLIKKDFIFQDIDTADNDTVKYKDFHGTAKEFVKYIGFGFPTSVFYDKDKSVAQLFPGIYDEQEFQVILRYISSEAYKKLDYDEYVKKNGIKEKE